MPKIKLPKTLLATEHLLIRKRAKRSIFAIAKACNKSIADLIEEMINKYIDEQFGDEGNPIQESYYIKE